jgi:hypothetical protein
VYIAFTGQCLAARAHPFLFLIKPVAFIIVYNTLPAAPSKAFAAIQAYVPVIIVYTFNAAVLFTHGTYQGIHPQIDVTLMTRAPYFHFLFLSVTNKKWIPQGLAVFLPVSWV